MTGKPTLLRSAIATLSIVILPITLLATAQSAEPAAPDDVQALVTKVEADVAELRGLPFKRPVSAERQSQEQFAEYLDGRLRDQVPDPQEQYFGYIVRKLGLYRGPLIT